MIRIILAAMLMSSSVAAHELTPTYFYFKPSYIEGVSITTVELWNRRDDAEYYEIYVADKDWGRIPFATRDRIIRLPHLSREKINIYVKQEDKARVEFICSSSKQLKSDVKSTGIKSTICSRIER